jgi:erythromycin esterase-like protein
MDAIDHWLDRAVLAPEQLDPADADVVVLGEMNHFVHEKSDFRLALARPLLARGFDVWGEELGWSDGSRIDEYMRTRDESIFERISLFGFRGDERNDRDDSLRGVFGAAPPYPFALMRAEQQRFYRGLHARGYFGFDVAAGHAGACADIATIDPHGLPAHWREQLAPVPGESIDAEIARLQRLRDALPHDADLRLRAALCARIDGLAYTDLVRDAATYDATRPAMAVREDAMKRRFADARALFPARRMVLLGHALHLAKDDAAISSGGVGPGGNRVSSLGHHINRELRLNTFVVWMLYGGGSDSQPLRDLPRTANYPPDSLNARLARRFTAPTLLHTAGAPTAPVRIGHLYNMLISVSLPGQVDAIWFAPAVTPLRAD